MRNTLKKKLAQEGIAVLESRSAGAYDARTRIGGKSRTFKDKKADASRRACRGPVRY